MFKKSAVDLTDLAMGIIVLGIVVSIGGTILLTFRDARTTELSVDSIVNETMGLVNETGELLDVKWVSGVTECTNLTGNQPIGSANYSVTVNTIDGAGTVAFVGADVNYNNTEHWVCTYNIYNTTRQDWQLANNASLGLAEYGNWFKIIVIVGVAALVLGLILLAFGDRSAIGEDVGGGSY